MTDDFWSARLPSNLTQANDVAEGLEALRRIIAEQAGSSADRNEADTRFHIIDRLLIECLGYPRQQIKCEPLTATGFADYAIGSPTLAIWEAKREGKTFEIPVSSQRRSIQRLASLMTVSSDVKEAIEQVNSYCLTHGTEVAIATNGHQLIAFVPVDLSRGHTGNAYIIRSLSDFETNFGRIWQLLSYPAICDGHLVDFLERSQQSQPPDRLAAHIPNYPQPRERSDLQSSLNTIADLLLLNIENQESLENVFYKECYVESGGLSQNSTVSKSILAARYASLFEGEEVAINAKPVKASAREDIFTPGLLAEAISNKPIILVGDVGVGKSSFIKHLRHVSAYDEFRNAIYIYIDLAFRAALHSSLKDFVLSAVESTLLEHYGIDIQEDEFVRRVYKKQLSRFERSPRGRLKEISPDEYLKAEVEFIGAITSDRSEHIKSSIQHLSQERRKQIIIAIDNADKRSSDLQQEAFLIAQNIASTWKAAVFVSMRPSTFYTSKRAGVLSAYQSRVFTIAPPRIDLVLGKRLKFALEIAQGKRELEQIQHVRLNLASVVALLRTVIPSIEQMTDTRIFLENITAGNVREVIEFLAEVIGSPNIDTEAVIRAAAEGDSFIIPTHDFWKVALKGEFNYFDPTKVRAINLFGTFSNDRSEHFLMPITLGYLKRAASHRSGEGFAETSKLMAELQSLGFALRSCEECLRRAVNDRIIESSLRVTFEEDEIGLYGNLPDKVRINTAGAYYLDYWMATFSYLDAVSVDMQFYDTNIRDQLIEYIRSLSLNDRFNRAVTVKQYLTDIWVGLGLSIDYFNWDEISHAQNWSFDRAKTAITRRSGVA